MKNYLGYYNGNRTVEALALNKTEATFLLNLIANKQKYTIGQKPVDLGVLNKLKQQQ